MVKKIKIEKLFTALDDEMHHKLSSKIDEIYHPTAKGDEIELNWTGLLKTYLPERYTVDRGFVVDHKGNISQQIDIIIYDRHFTPFIFRGENISYIPVEGVYAVFEVKPHFDKSNFDYAISKLESVKNLKMTSATFKHATGSNKTEPFDIIGGILTSKSKSKKLFNEIGIDSKLSVILALDSGVKIINNKMVIERSGKPILAFFLLKLIEKLRLLGSVPALEVDKYLDFVE